jgi:hypothetical protein
MCDEQKIQVVEERAERVGSEATDFRGSENDFRGSENDFRVSGLDAELRSLALLEDLKTYVESQYLPMCEQMTSFDVQEFFFPSLVKTRRIVLLDNEDSDETETCLDD